jgi:Sulfatase-modifying factor enzyme 1
MIEVRGHGVAAELAAHPVTKAEYRAYLREAGHANPPSLAPEERASDSVTYVSQDAAIFFCRWLGKQEGHAYRLPSMSELCELASEAAADGVDSECWPHHHEHHPELRGGMKPLYLCEWTLETETISQPGGRTRVLGSVFYPPWLRQGPNASHLQACLLASEGYSFVTFRLARNL